MSLTEEQQRTVDRVVAEQHPSPYDLGVLSAYLRATSDPVIRQRIEATLERHGKEPK